MMPFIAAIPNSATKPIAAEMLNGMSARNSASTPPVKAIGMALPVWAIELARYRMPAGQFDRILLGEIGGPEEACAAGFLDRVVAPDDLLTEATATATRLTALRTGAVAGTKERARTELARRMLEGLDDDLAALSPPG